MKSKKLTFILFLLAFGVFGYLRERFFEHMNIILASVYRGTNEYVNIHQEIPVLMAPFMKWSYPSLYYSKYPFTLIWTLVFFLLSHFALKKLTDQPKFLDWLRYTYLAMLCLAFFSMLFGYLLQGTLKNDEYTFSRWLLGIAQSPIICLILLASSKLYPNTQSYDK